MVRKNVKRISMHKAKAGTDGNPKHKISSVKRTAGASDSPDHEGKVIESYRFMSMNIPVQVTIAKTKTDYVPVYSLDVAVISQTTKIILERIREELIKAVNLGIVEIRDIKSRDAIDTKFSDTILKLVTRYFPDASTEEKQFMTTYLIQRSLGMGTLELLNDDPNLEEIVINSADSPVWVYHKKYGWLKTNIFLKNEEQTRHYAVTIGRKVGRQLSVLEPLLDAHLAEGDRVNATLYPISTGGNTITIRRFSRDPWTITNFLEFNTMSTQAAAMIWMGIQYELSAIIAGGTASGKTSTLNVLANFFPPNQRILSIEDTRELHLPKFLHWVPLSTRLPNVEGKGEISMSDLLINSLRMRPDRILVGEVRRQREAETLFEAIHTGHSCYATFHANDAHETINRFTNPPIDVPKTMMPAISMIIIQFRNRRTGMRRTFQVAEILPDASPNVLMQYDPKRDVLTKKNKSRALYSTLQLFTGSTPNEINKELLEKETVLKYLVKNQIKSIDEVGQFMAEYYINKDELMKYVYANKRFFPASAPAVIVKPKSPGPGAASGKDKKE
ncbi:MAG: ATPase, T2SS/T4P/T4SS family [Candidatus Woesearchaeota archaeon]